MNTTHAYSTPKHGGAGIFDLGCSCPGNVELVEHESLCQVARRFCPSVPSWCLAKQYLFSAQARRYCRSSWLISDHSLGPRVKEHWGRHSPLIFKLRHPGRSPCCTQRFGLKLPVACRVRHGCRPRGHKGLDNLIYNAPDFLPHSVRPTPLSFCHGRTECGEDRAGRVNTAAAFLG